MKPGPLIERLKKSAPAPGYLFLGNEPYFRDRCRRALIQAVRGMAGTGDGAADEAGDETGDGDWDGIAEFDLRGQPLEELIDEARTLSLFASARIVIGGDAGFALPKTGGAAKSAAGAAMLKSYFDNPTPGVVILFEATRYDWADRDDKAKIERVAKFFSAVPEIVELQQPAPGETLAIAKRLARRSGLVMDPATLGGLVEMLGGDLARLATELEKLSVYAGEGGRVESQDIELLIPEARRRGLYEFSDALAHKDAARALEIVDTLAGSGVYWPMQITVLAGLFRQALVVREERLGGIPDVSRAFQREKIRIWPARAKQLLEIARLFSETEIENALRRFFEADRDLRRERPDDRLIMEQLVIGLTAV